MDFSLAGGKSIRVLAPFADMVNHSPEVKQSHVYDTSSGNLSIIAGKDYEAGDQVRQAYSLVVTIWLLTWGYFPGIHLLWSYSK